MSDWNQLLPSSHADTFTRDRLPPKDQWPVFLADRPELHYPDRLNVTSELVDLHVHQSRANRIALHGQHGMDPLAPFSWTYAQLQAQVDRIAHVLTQDLQLISGNRVLLRGGNSPMMAACLLATFKAGLVAVPTMPLLRATELATIIDKAQVSAALCDALLADELQACMNPAHPQYSPVLKQCLLFRSPDPQGLEQRMQ